MSYLRRLKRMVDILSGKKPKTQSLVTAAPPPPPSTEPPPKQVARSRPQILLIDLQEDCSRLLAGAGFNVSSGTFGSIYRVKPGAQALPVPFETRLGPHAEKDIIIVDLDVALSPLPDDFPNAPEGIDRDWASCEHGRIDTRPVGMSAAAGTLDRIVSNGGVVVVFAQPRRTTKYVRGALRSFGVQQSGESRLDDWSFLSVLGAVETTLDHGQEMRVLESGPFGVFLRRHLSDSTFSCTLSPERYGAYIPNIKKEWRSLATNRYDASVAAAIMPDASHTGLVLILPEISRKPEFLRELLSDILPEMMPSLFPEHADGKWVHQPEYEAREIVQIRHNIETIRAEANKQIVACNSAIETAQAEYAFMYDLLRETGPQLVTAVRLALEKLGFSEVVDVDAENIRQGKKDMAEDLWIVEPGRDLLLVEVKGLTRLAPDAESLQAWKYVAPRMKELKRLDIQALAIINHQRNLPPLDRNNDNVFRQEVITNAEEHGFGLMTTWDLFRIIRNGARNGWDSESVKAMFYRHGRLSPIPEHYKKIGVVARVLDQRGVVSVRLEDESLSCGETIAFVRPVDIYEQKVESMQVDRASVERAAKGQVVGIKTSFPLDEIRVDMPVFRANW